MTKYYFIGYMCQTEARILHTNCLCKVVDKTLNDICFDIARRNNVTTRSVVITSLKDLTKKEYEMLKEKEE